MERKLLHFVFTLISTIMIGMAALVLYAEIFMKTTLFVSDEVDVIPTNVEPTGLSVANQGEAQLNMDGETDQEGALSKGKGEVILTFGGDICFHDEYSNMQTLSTRGGTIDSCISEGLLKEMQEADICMVNNEFPYSDRGTPIPEKLYTFRSKPENVTLLHEMGVDVVSLANNHTYDYGEEAFLDTLSVLENAQVKYVGAGRNLEEASQAEYFKVNNVVIGILSATQIERLESPDTKGATESSPGVLRCFTESELDHFIEAVEEADDQCDVLVVYMHWGTENTDELDWAQTYQADLITKAGADLIVGAHPHCLQGIDGVNGVPVIYSLGNYWFNSKAMDTALLKVIVQGNEVKGVQIIPARQEDCKTSTLRGKEKQRVLDNLRSLSQNVEIDNLGYIKWKKGA